MVDYPPGLKRSRTPATHRDRSWITYSCTAPKHSHHRKNINTWTRTRLLKLWVCGRVPALYGTQHNYAHTHCPKKNQKKNEHTARFHPPTTQFTRAWIPASGWGPSKISYVASFCCAQALSFNVSRCSPAVWVSIGRQRDEYNANGWHFRTIWYKHSITIRHHLCIMLIYAGYRSFSKKRGASVSKW